MFKHLLHRNATREELTEEEIESGLHTLIVSGVLSQILVTFTGGAFLVALALELGASNFVVGLLAAVSPLAQLLQLPSVYLVEKLRNRRLLSVVSTGTSRLTWFGIALIPLFFDSEVGLPFLIAAVLLQSGLGALSGASWNSWMRDLVPEDRLGTFFSRRMMIMGILGAVLSPLAGLFVDWWAAYSGQDPMSAFAVLFAAGAAAGVLGTVSLARVPEPPMTPSEEPFNFFRSIRLPFRSENFRRLMVYQGVWNFAINLASPFFTVYLLQSLGLNMSTVVILSTMSQVVNLFFLPAWGRVSDQYSNKAILRAATPLFLASIVAWTFTTLPGRHFLTLPLLVLIHVISGLASAGIGLATGNIGFKLAPRGEAASYLGVMGVINSLAAGLAPIIGGRTADFFTNRELSLTLAYSRPGQNFAFEAFGLEGWDFFFMFAFLLGLFALHQLAYVREAAEADDVTEEVVVKEVVTQARREMRSLSTVGGLRHMVQLPTEVLAGLRDVMRGSRQKPAAGSSARPQG